MGMYVRNHSFSGGMVSVVSLRMRLGTFSAIVSADAVELVCAWVGSGGMLGVCGDWQAVRRSKKNKMIGFFMMLCIVG